MLPTDQPTNPPTHQPFSRLTTHDTGLMTRTVTVSSTETNTDGVAELALRKLANIINAKKCQKSSTEYKNDSNGSHNNQNKNTLTFSSKIPKIKEIMIKLNMKCRNIFSGVKFYSYYGRWQFLIEEGDRCER